MAEITWQRDEIHVLEIPLWVDEKIVTHSKWETQISYSGGFVAYCTSCCARQKMYWHQRGSLSLCSVCFQPHPFSRRECYGCADEFYAFEKSKIYCKECEPTS